ncbi:type IV secretory system conjugative DNA transfer family protein [Halomicronema sp. CCY15110]|uniref:type IV secretory system conjugative DNA transfer family protein n=1 Tax=Halomicronema sp. CCY15110 TaxID=2767773 RepID=UPI0019512013|nr:type IV secretion system DNA-binding domain-containing protein [Halomicronema sp. CCY15110]
MRKNDERFGLLAQAEVTETIESVPAFQTISDSLGPALQPLMGRSGLILLAAAVGLMVVQLIDRGKTGKIARGSLSGGKEKAKSRKRALQQLNAREPDSVALYVGSLKRNKTGKITGSRKTLFLSDAQRGIAVAGGPGSGKTFSVINPVIRSALDEGFPALVYDFKYPAQTECLAAYAAKRGYDVRVFAPGYPESEVCNPLDFMADANDALMARQIATVMNRNFARSSNSSEDKFFADAGDQLTQAILMLAKGMPIPDLMTGSAILGLDSLPDRIIEAKRLGDLGRLPDQWQISHWVYYAFSQLMQLKDSEKTVAGVLGTAGKVFSRFMAPELISTFCGKTTLPIELKGRQLVILGMDRRRREAVAPLVATVLHLMVTMNVTRKRKDPLLLAIDELPTLYLPYLTQWLNENRSDGLCTMIGFQNITQLEDAYKRDIARSILGGCATKAIFNPQDADSARMFSDYLGDEEVIIKQKSRNSGGRGGASHSVSKQVQKRRIVEPAQFNRLATGKCVLISPGFARKDETSIPLISKIKVPQADVKEGKWSEETWEKVRAKLIQRSPQSLRESARANQQMAICQAMVENYLPLPTDDEAEDVQASPLVPVLDADPAAAEVIDPNALLEFSEVF